MMNLIESFSIPALFPEEPYYLTLKFLSLSAFETTVTDDIRIAPAANIGLRRMSRISQGMVLDTINAFVQENVILAKDVIMRDDEVDDLNAAVSEELMAIMTRDPSTVSRVMKINFISKYLERIADHATNIAEDVIYMVEGKIIRHMEPGKL